MLLDVIEDTLVDALKLLPFLFLTYLAMEYIEHKAGDKAEELVEKAGGFGPLIGSVLGMVPQCGFSAAASNLYAGRIITLGTLISIFLSTSDEMLPVFISNQVAIGTILKILSIKVLIGMAAGFVIDLVLQKKHKETGETEHLKIDEMCDHQHCHCGQGNIWKAAISHTLQILFFIVVVYPESADQLYRGGQSFNAAQQQTDAWPCDRRSCGTDPKLCGIGGIDTVVSGRNDKWRCHDGRTPGRSRGRASRVVPC